ncbi:MAG: potassium transporter Kup [Alphaproteobacteria bacterium]|nr:potassium transporter Kup [Alphaproteobacteria bacterium]
MTSSPTDSASGHAASSPGGLFGLCVGAVGVVYGDIGTSPLYTLKECFSELTGIEPNLPNVLGILSLITWSLFLVVTLKYIVLVMRADNRGEGGILAMTALALRHVQKDPRLHAVLMGLGIFGCALFYGDAIITPSMSVLSAIEGLDVVSPAFSHYVVPLTCVVLVGVFIVQKRGTASVSALFGPITVVWFLALAALGINQIIDEPRVLWALNPIYALEFGIDHKVLAFLALGAVVLSITGAEALYADMGHFGKRPIRLAWLFLVFPALLLNYYGQGALLIDQPEAAKNPFYLIVPEWARYPMIVLATMATVIACQAVITGAYSMSRQAVQLGYLPRLRVLHTSEKAIGQIYMPQINWLLMIAVLILVLSFKSSANLAAAYGIAVTGTMLITTIMASVVAATLWRWRPVTIIAVFGFFLIIDIAFVSANIIKLPDGGWFPVVIAMIVFLLMTTWHKGRGIFIARLRADALSLDAFLARLQVNPPMRVPGTAVFMTSSKDGVPYALLHNLKHNKVLHNRVVFMTVQTLDVPSVSGPERIDIETLAENVYRIAIRYGFKEEPDIPEAMRQCASRGLTFNMMETSFFLGRETIIPTRRPDISMWREKLYIAMTRQAVSVTEFFRIPTNRVVELGTQIEL